MKKIFTLALTLTLFLTFSCTRKKAASTSTTDNTQGEELAGTISISGAFALYPMVIRWGEEFKKLHPQIRFDVSAGGAGKGISDALGELVDLGAVSREIYPEEIKKGAFPIAVTKDAVIATVNAMNPNIKEILSKGLTRQSFKNIYVEGTFKDWKQTGFSVSAPIHAYTRSDAAGAAETWAKYLDKNQEDLLGIGVFGDPGLLLAVKKDPFAIGFNNMAYVYDGKTQKQFPGIIIIPIDINENGKIDVEENFYSTQHELINAITEGKYPSPPARALYLVSKNKPNKKIVIEFLKWVLSDGQKFVGPSGFIALSSEDLTSELIKITP